STSRGFELGGPTTTFGGLLYNNLIVGSNGLAPCQTPGFVVPFCGVPGLIQLPVLPAGTPRYDSQWITHNLYTSDATGPTGSRYQISGVSATLDWSIPGLRAKSITAYRHAALDYARDPDGSPLTIIETSNRTRTAQLSQELQVGGDAGGQTLR